MTTLRTVTCFLLLLASGTAWSQQAPTPASSMPLIDVPSAIRTQPLASGEVTQLTFMTGMKPARTVARTWWMVRAPAMTPMEER